MKNKGPLYVLTCYVIWGLLPIFWKLLAQVDSLYVLASRIVPIICANLGGFYGKASCCCGGTGWPVCGPRSGTGGSGGCWPLRAAWSASTGASTSGRWPTGT